MVKMMVVLGELGGRDEYSLIEALKEGKIQKPVVAWVSGTCARFFMSEVQFGHAALPLVEMYFQVLLFQITSLVIIISHRPLIMGNSNNKPKNQNPKSLMTVKEPSNSTASTSQPYREVGLSIALTLQEENLNPKFPTMVKKPLNSTALTSQPYREDGLSIALTLREENQNPKSPTIVKEPSSSMASTSQPYREDDLQEEDDYDYYSSEYSDYSDEEDFDFDGENAESINPMDYPNDESYARALQILMDENLARNMMALSIAQERMDRRILRNRRNSQGTRQDSIDIDDYSYEEMLALGEAIGHVSKGLSADRIKSLPTINYKAGTTTHLDKCTICQMEWEDRDLLNVLPCKHQFHFACICKWLEISKVCPECKAEVN